MRFLGFRVSLCAGAVARFQGLDVRKEDVVRVSLGFRKEEGSKEEGVRGRKRVSEYR